jgi:hypothetical protein
MQNRSLSIYFIVLLTILLGSCISGSGIYQSHYPNKLKQGKLKKVIHTNSQNEDETPVSGKQLDIQSISENKNQIDDQFNTELASLDMPDNSMAYDATLDADVVAESASNKEILKPVYSNRNQNSTSNDNCPKVTDLTCAYMGKDTYKLTWTQPKGLYSDNGRLSEYRIIRESLSDSKIYVFKTPEPICEGSNCSIVFYSQTEPAGYKWTIETRCDQTTFIRGNSIDCKPDTNIDYKPDASIDEEPIFAENQNGKRLNKKSLLSVLMIPMLMIAGILVVILLFQDLPFLAGLLLVGIAVGCIVSIVKAVQGGREVKNSKGKQWGTGLSVLAILGAILGLFLSGFLMYVVFTLFTY